MLGNITERPPPGKLAKGRQLIADLFDAGTSSIGDRARQFLGSPNVNRRFAENILRDTHRPEVFAARARQKRKVALIATYHNYPFFLTYHYRWADTLSAAGFVVYFLHASDCLSPLLSEIDRNDTFLCVKKNAGFDFGSYSVGFHSLKDVLTDIDEILLTNDSLIGPATDLSNLFSKIRSCGADFVGLTDSYERGYHFQAYFIWLGRNAVQSSVLSSFFDNPRFAEVARGSHRRKNMVRERMVVHGELALTRLLLDARLRCHALYPYQEVADRWLARLPSFVQQVTNLPGLEPATEREGSAYRPFKRQLLEVLDATAARVVGGQPLNPTVHFWDVLIEDFGFPFIKRDIVTANPRDVPTYFRISDVLRCFPGHVTEHLIEVQQHWPGVKVPFIARERSDRLPDPSVPLAEDLYPGTGG